MQRQGLHTTFELSSGGSLIEDGGH
jgi:hypothetical protein